MIKRITDKILSSLSIRIRNANVIEISNNSSIHSDTLLKGVTIYGNVIINNGCKIIGGVSIHSNSLVRIGRFTSINGPNTDIKCSINNVFIGSFTSIARNVSIQEFNHKFDSLSTYHINQNIFNDNRSNDIISNGQIIIGNDVWIGTQCIILSGATIGDGAIVAANSVVRGEIPPYSIVAGSPAKVIGYRFHQDIVDYLTKLKWWDRSLKEIHMNRKIFKDKLKLDDLKQWVSL